MVSQEWQGLISDMEQNHLDRSAPISQRNVASGKCSELEQIISKSIPKQKQTQKLQ